MSHSFVKIGIHAIWATKERSHLISPKIEGAFYNYIQSQFVDLNCPVLNINGMPDHIHCLFLINQQKSVAEVIKQIKGSTSHWINEQNLIPNKFAWQTGYAAFGVSESQFERVFNYIKNQKEHHAKITFSTEYDEFIKLHGFER